VSEFPDRMRIVQHAWVVPDIEAAMRHWHRAMGVGPFLLLRHLKQTDPHYRGRPLQPDFSVAMAQAGDCQVELICQHCDQPSVYRDTVAPGTTAFHHVAVIVPDYDAELARYEAQGHERAAWGVFGDLRFAYVDTHASLGAMVEVIEDKPSIRSFFARVRDARSTWDGTGDPWIEL